MTKEREILNIIEAIRDSHPLMVKIFTEGSCLEFHNILRKIFPEAKPVYLDIEGHVVTEIDGKYYDITGSVTLNEPPPSFKETCSRKGISRMLRSKYAESYGSIARQGAEITNGRYTSSNGVILTDLTLGANSYEVRFLSTEDAKKKQEEYYTNLELEMEKRLYTGSVNAFKSLTNGK